MKSQIINEAIRFIWGFIHLPVQSYIMETLQIMPVVAQNQSTFSTCNQLLIFVNYEDIHSISKAIHHEATNIGSWCGSTTGDYTQPCKE